ncbi:hypothetical protein LTR37_004664 [Vermiconidia calcicola]|uniref:Uncharacterized protein n=1 Tax=Vermiconidia calcicola TaxID=1690605 RepID=A0ACC3NLL7_9PEZI|nr:hypothetical protein LTR37_004664 [Vermiconidia calcicola]
MSVLQLDSETVRDLTLEPPNIVRDRELNRKRLNTLQEILCVCNKRTNRFATHAQQTNEVETQSTNAVRSHHGTAVIPKRTKPDENVVRFNPPGLPGTTPRSLQALRGYPTPPLTPEPSSSAQATPTPARTASRRSRPNSSELRNPPAFRSGAPLGPAGTAEISRTPSPLQISVHSASEDTQEVAPSSEEL